MSQRLRERHETLRQAEVPLGPVRRVGDFRIALGYPNLYYVGMSNLGFQGVYQMFNAHPAVLCRVVRRQTTEGAPQGQGERVQGAAGSVTRFRLEPMSRPCVDLFSEAAAG